MNILYYVRYGIRARFFQDFVREALWSHNCEQVVIFNSLSDSLPWRLQLNENMNLYPCFLKKSHERQTLKLFGAFPPGQGKVTPVTLDYTDVKTWISTLENFGFDSQKKSAFIIQHLSRFLHKNEYQDLISKLELMPSGSVVATEFWGETLWGHSAYDIDAMQGTLNSFNFLLDNPEDLFDSGKWKTNKHTPKSLNYDSRATSFPPGPYNFVFGISTLKE